MQVVNFHNENYKYSGGLHGVGVSVVNALSTSLEVFVKRDGNLYHMLFKDGDKASELKVIDSVGQRNTGTIIKFYPNPKYFDSPNVSITKLIHLLRAKAVLCPGLRIVFEDNTVSAEKSQSNEWYFEDGLADYLKQATNGFETLPAEPFTGTMEGN